MKTLKEYIASIKTLVNPVKIDERGYKPKPVNPISKRIYDKMLLAIAKESDMYALAEKEPIYKAHLGECEGCGCELPIVVDNASLPQRARFVDYEDEYYEWPSEHIKVQPYRNSTFMRRDSVPLLLSTMVQGITLDKQVMYHPFRNEIEYMALNAKQSIDRIIPHLVAEQHGEVTDKNLVLKHSITTEQLRKVLSNNAEGLIPYLDHQAWRKTADGNVIEEDYAYFLCATSKGRLEHLKGRPGEWESRLTYKDYIERKQFVSESGRVMVSDGVYVVFLECLDDRDMHNIVFGREPFVRVPALDDNLHMAFTCVPKGDDKKEWKDEGTLIHWRMEFAAEAIPGRYVLLSAKKQG